MNPSKPPVATCPQCGKQSPWDVGNRYRPFCCERCKMIDLGKWANEEFRVAVAVTDEEPESPPYQA